MGVGHRQVGRRPSHVQRRDALSHPGRGIERARAGDRRVVVREDREDAVAHELQNVSAMCLDLLDRAWA